MGAAEELVKRYRRVLSSSDIRLAATSPSYPQQLRLLELQQLHSNPSPSTFLLERTRTHDGHLLSPVLLHTRELDLAELSLGGVLWAGGEGDSIVGRNFRQVCSDDEGCVAGISERVLGEPSGLADNSCHFG